MDGSAASTMPNASPLPPVPSSAFWSESQWAVMLALMQATYPSLATARRVQNPRGQIAISGNQIASFYDALRASMGKSAPSREKYEVFLEHDPTSTPEFFGALVRTLAGLPRQQRRVLSILMWLLSTRMGNWFLTGHFRSFNSLPVGSREAVLRSWGRSRMKSLRVMAKTFTATAKWITLRIDDTFIRLLGYPSPSRPVNLPDRVHRLVFERCPSLPPGAPTDHHIITSDVVIVGSGCGGAICARILAEAGHSVVVVDKAYHFPVSHMPMSQEQGTFHLYENNGLVSTEDLSVSIVAGSAWGGGGTVNWGVSLQTQDYVRREWAEKDGLPMFASNEYQQSLDRVCAVMGASTEGIRHNHRNRVLLDAGRRLGWKGGATPINSAGQDHYCGQCHLGCPTTGKRGPLVSCLPAAAEHGARFFEGLQVDRVMFDDDGRGEKVARGVVGTWTSRDENDAVHGPAHRRTTRTVEVRAKRVIISAGSLWSPVLLLNSGIKNPLIGSKLHLHPCNFVIGIYDGDVRPWEGGIITSCIDSFENLDGAGHGVKLEPSGMVPYSILSFLPWRDALSHKSDLLRYRNMAAFIALTRDRDSGRVFPDPHSGRPRVMYTPSDFDRKHTLEGVIALAKACYVTGAREIRILHHDVDPFVVVGPLSQKHTDDKETTDTKLAEPDFAAWLSSVRRKILGSPPSLGMWASAHQMGTCRMSGHGPRAGVVDACGRVHGTRGLYIADASVLPSASGVNPMVTVMAIADGIARGVVRELNLERASKMEI